jgi:malonate-semialdehyde dehydrogenase (acetylating)/methylmalonate-semialdehyde dehydrogenase
MPLELRAGDVMAEGFRDRPFVSLWIGGNACASRAERFGDVFDPALGRAIRHVPLCGVDDVERAVDAAADAFPAWRDTPPQRRARILLRFRGLLEENEDALARLISEENGKTLAEALGEVRLGMAAVEFASGISHLLKGEFSQNVGADVDCSSAREPVGVCVGIAPCNLPALVALSMFPLAIACGNSFVLKPSHRAPSASLRMAELLGEAGLPPGVFNVVHGDAEAVDALLHRPRVAAVSFVGSTRIAQHIHEAGARAQMRVQALGGACAHAVVLEDADVSRSSEALAAAAFGAAQGRYMPTPVVVAVGRVNDALVQALARRAAGLRLGPGTAPGVDLGPLILATHRDRALAFVEQGLAEGARLVADGRAASVAGFEGGFFLGPCLLEGVSPQTSLCREEVLGPVLAVVRVASLEEAIDFINRGLAGHAAAIFTRSGAAARRFQNRASVGMVGINMPVPMPSASFSCGGWKRSLGGDLHLLGMDGVRFYTRLKVVTSHWPDEREDIL